MTKTTTIRIDAAQYQDHDDCLTAAADDAACKYDLEGWDLNPRWEDDQRETILIDLPGLYEIVVTDLNGWDGDGSSADVIWGEYADRSDRFFATEAEAESALAKLRASGDWSWWEIDERGDQVKMSNDGPIYAVESVVAG